MSIEYGKEILSIPYLQLPDKNSQNFWRWFVFSQIKHTLQLSKFADSDVASALDQFVRQFLTNRAGTSEGRPRERPLDPVRDRLVLVTGPRSSELIHVRIPAIFGVDLDLPQSYPDTA